MMKYYSTKEVCVCSSVGLCHIFRTVFTKTTILVYVKYQRVGFIAQELKVNRNLTCAIISNSYIKLLYQVSGRLHLLFIINSSWISFHI